VDQITENAERRSYDRVVKEFVFNYAILADLANTELSEEGLILDIGGGGLRFLASRKWEKNEQLLMQLDFKGWHIDGVSCVICDNNQECGSMMVVGSVMWSAETASEDEFEVGVRFTARMETNKE
jgi:hypothetical protein